MAANLAPVPPPRPVTTTSQRWATRRDVAIATLVWVIIIVGIIWAASHVMRAILILVVAGLLAYALLPAVAFLTRFVPRWLAILVVYLAFVSVIGALGYLVVTSAIDQISALSQQVSGLITTQPGATAPIVTRLEKLGISQSQIKAASDQLLAQTQVVVASVVPFLEGFFNGMLDAILVTVLSIYLLVDGERVIQWVRQSAPVKHRPRVAFAILTLQRVVGGYIRGQLILCTLIGTLVGVGMGLLGVPYAVLLGVLAFILEFIPVIGVLVSGVACVLMALTQSWLLALCVLAYFIFVHVIEGDVVGPRVVGKAVGVHPAVSIFALVAGAELFGIWGALFASPIAGLAQAILSEAWEEWRELHANQFPERFGTPAVPVTTAEAVAQTEVTTTITTAQREARPPGESAADEQDDGATTAADPFEQAPLLAR
jgi:predicted PurR-regulated permease PerM